MPLTADRLHDPAAVDFARRVEVVRHDDFDGAFPTTVPARVIVGARGGRFEAFVERPWGEPGGPTGRPELIGKLHDLAAGRLGAERAAAIVAAVEDLRNGPAAPLLDVLGGPMQDLVPRQAGPHHAAD